MANGGKAPIRWLTSTATAASSSDARRWRGGALDTLDVVCSLDDVASVRCARARRAEITGILDELGAADGTPVLEGHGDLHVGQVLLGGGRFAVTDFDGNPVLTAHERMSAIPAALDVAGMVQSLAHVAIVAAKYAHLDPTALAAVDVSGRSAFLGAYAQRLTALGHAGLYRPELLRAFRVQQVLREIIYVARHLPRWGYVPDAALPAVLDEGATP